MGSKSKYQIMKSFLTIQKGSRINPDNYRDQKRKTLQDIISKSLKKGLKSSGNIVNL